MIAAAVVAEHHSVMLGAECIYSLCLPCREWLVGSCEYGDSTFRQFWEYVMGLMAMHHSARWKFPHGEVPAVTCVEVDVGGTSAFAE